jgi:predicted nucleic acid-binding protein
MARVASNILVDTDALVATIKEDDSNHKKAIAIDKKFKNSTYYITPFTIPETATVLSNKMSQKTAKEFLSKARIENFVEVPLTPDLVREADQIFVSQNKKGTSWIDCLNVAVVRSKKLDGIFSFDKFYQKLGLKTY